MASRRLRLLRIIMLGDPNVGKTSLLARYVQGKWRSGYRATLGADFFTKDVSIEIDNREQLVTLQLWDTAGMERCMSAMGPAFFRGADAVCLCFDITDRRGFENLEAWRQLFFQHSRAANPNQIPMIVLGNKADLAAERTVRYEEIKRWCREHGDLPYFEVSAKEDNNVSTAFKECAMIALTAMAAEPEPDPLPPVPVFVLGQPKQQNSTCCF